jgi:hypothetical protein
MAKQPVKIVPISWSASDQARAQAEGWQINGGYVIVMLKHDDEEKQKFSSNAEALMHVTTHADSECCSICTKGLCFVAQKHGSIASFEASGHDAGSTKKSTKSSEEAVDTKMMKKVMKYAHDLWVDARCITNMYEGLDEGDQEVVDGHLSSSDMGDLCDEVERCPEVVKDYEG